MFDMLLAFAASGLIVCLMLMTVPMRPASRILLSIGAVVFLAIWLMGIMGWVDIPQGPFQK